MTRVILDTNVLMSGIFWSGPPAKILQAWHDKKISLVLSPEILEEYRRVGSILSQKYPVINVEPIIDLIVIHSEMCSANKLNKQISNDPDDDKFIALCLSSDCRIIVSGDRDLLEISGYESISVMKPAQFVEQYLPNN